MSGRNRNDAINHEGVEASESRVSEMGTQDGAGRSRGDTVPPDSSHIYERSNSRMERPADGNTTAMDVEGTQPRISFSRRSEEENPKHVTSRQGISSSRRYNESSDAPSRALPSPLETPRANGSFLDTSRARSGIDMSFSHVEHSTPIRPSGPRGHAVVEGVRGLLGPSSEEDDTVDSEFLFEYSSSPLLEADLTLFRHSFQLSAFTVNSNQQDAERDDERKFV